MSPKTACQHHNLVSVLSPHATGTGYRRPTGKQRSNAAGLSTNDHKDDDQTFPAPLILPGDDLALDPKYPSQSVRSWLHDKDRNEITDARRTIYIVPPPNIPPIVEFVSSWTYPVSQRGSRDYSLDLSHVADYVAAFYHGLPVKLLPKSTFGFAAWSEDLKDLAKLKAGRSKKPLLIGLNTGSELVGIRCRPAPDKTFSRQLNLNDLIDGAIGALPEDAYALVMLVDHDLYEDEEDEFVCGRAYGGSRVAAISSARYDPMLDPKSGLDRTHAWPNSHCADFIHSLLLDSDNEPEDKTGNKSAMIVTSDGLNSPSAVTTASKAITSFQATGSQADFSKGLWLGRMCRTVTHELGHCFGIDHCVYYACCMQGSASLLEDMRQPPYLCPIDLIKVLRSTGGTEKQHYTAMIEFCKRHQNTEMFIAYKAWIYERLKQL